MTRILLLSTTTGYQLRSFGDAADRLGVELLFATDACHQLDDPWQDQAIAVRFHDEEASLDAILEAARERPLQGLVAVGDRPVRLAALAAEALGVPWHPVAAAEASANKKRARERFRSAGLVVPWFFEVPPGADAESVVADVRFPAVVKPLGLSGSRGVIRADSVEELRAAFERVRALLARPDVRALGDGLADTLIVEGFMAGREYAIEGVLTGGRLQVFAIFDKPDPLDGPFFEETIYATPPALSEADERTIVDATTRAAAALGLRHGPLHAECRLGPYGVFVLEIAARPIGGLCSRVLRFDGESASATFSLEDVLLRHAAGHDVSGFRRETRGAAVMMVPIPKRGLLKRVEGEAEAASVEGVEEVRVTAKRDQLLEPLPEAGSYLGFIFARGATAQQAEASVRAAHGRLRFVISPPIPVAPAR